MSDRTENGRRPDFSPLAERYARARPDYPRELFAHLANLVGRRDLAWDAATGSGQAAAGLAGHFDRVIATDVSAEQIRHAYPHPKVEYKVAPSESSGLPGGCVDVVTVAAAVHWFDVAAFSAEVERVTRPGGILAVWTYHIGIMEPPFDRIFDTFYRDVLKPHFAEGARLVDELYETLILPGEPLPAPKLHVSAEWRHAQLLDFIHSWSGAVKYQEAHGFDPVDVIAEELDAIWGGRDEIRSLKWPLFARISRL